MPADRGLNLKSKKQFGHSCSDVVGRFSEHAEHIQFFLTLWLQDPYSTGEAKPGCIYPVEQDSFPLSDPRKAGGRPASHSHLWHCFVVLARVKRFTRHQYKHRCWCYQRLLLVCLFICIKLASRNPPSTTAPEQSQLQWCSPIGYHMLWHESALSLTHTWQDAWSALSMCRQWKVCPKLSRGKCRLGLGGLPPTAWCKGGQWLSGVCTSHLHAPHTVHHNRGAQGARAAKHKIRLDEQPYSRWFIIKPKPFCNGARFTHRW